VLATVTWWRPTHGRAVRILNSDGSDPRDVINFEGGGSLLKDAVWSPDGKTIALRYQTGSDFGVWVANHDGMGLRKLESGTIADYPRNWSVDGNWIISESSDDGILYALEYAGSRRLPLSQLSSLPVYDQRYSPWRVTSQPACSGDPSDTAAFFDCQ
jgi:Tol biopolymer transport system component